MSDLDELKDLLFGAEKQALDSIAQRVESRDVRAADVADVLPEAIYQRHKKDKELVDSLKQPVGECIQQGLREEPETYSDALYPIIGPTIRKAITHALKSFSEQINQALEHSISPKGLKWRMEASRAGIPFGEYVVQKTLLYRVEQAYLISRDNGLLMAHVHHEASKIKDSDAVSAMFTAIQDFVKESFSPDRTGRLESADMGEFTLWAVHGPHALLVCVIRGVPPRSLRSDLSAILERIHFRYGDAIREYRGDTSSVPEVEVELERCLRFEAKQEDGAQQETEEDKDDKDDKRPKRAVAIISALLIVAALAYYGVKRWDAMQELESLEAALSSAPGIYVAAIERDGDAYLVRGLRDPLAPDFAAIAQDLDIAPEKLQSSMRPYQSLDPEMIVVRSERLLGRPENVRYGVSGSTLMVSGDAPWAWEQQLRRTYLNVAGIDSLDSTGLTTSDRQRFVDAIKSLDGQRFFFDSGVSLSAGAGEALAEYGARLQKLAQDAGRFGYSLQASLIGSTDSSGSAAVNASLAMARARAVAYLLAPHDIEVHDMQRSTTDVDASAAKPDINPRHVRVVLKLISTMPAS